MKVLYLTKYTRKGASSRMRCYQYFPYLSEKGIEITVKPLFEDDYLDKLYNGKTPFFQIAKAYMRRFFTLFTVFKYDRVFIEKEIFPFLPAWPEKILSLLKVDYIVDYDDAIFHNYDQHPNKFFRKLMKHKIDIVMRNSSAVIVGNNYLGDRAHKAGAKKVFVVPTVIDLDRYTVKNSIKDNPLVIGWIGTKSTFEKHFLAEKDWMKKVTIKFNIKFHVVGIKENLRLGDYIHYFPWSEQTEVDAILKFDIGIMPLQDSLWEKGKCAYKLIQYMACGVPVIASPIGMNLEVVKENENGFLASTESQWLAAIEKYANDPQLRKNHGLKGRKIVGDKFCLHVTQLQILQIIRG